MCGFLWSCSELYLLGASTPVSRMLKTSSEMSWILQHKLVLKNCDNVSKHNPSHSPYPTAETTACSMLTTQHKQQCFLQLPMSVIQDGPALPSASGGQAGVPPQGRWQLKQSQPNAVRLVGFGNRHWSLEGYWSGGRFAFMLCQLTSEAFLSLSWTK